MCTGLQSKKQNTMPSLVSLGSRWASLFWYTIERKIILNRWTRQENSLFINPTVTVASICLNGGIKIEKSDQDKVSYLKCWTDVRAEALVKSWTESWTEAEVEMLMFICAVVTSSLAVIYFLSNLCTIHTNTTSSFSSHHVFFFIVL